MSALTNQPTCAHDGCHELAWVFVAFPVLSMASPDLGEWFCDEHVPPVWGEGRRQRQEGGER